VRGKTRWRTTATAGIADDGHCGDAVLCEDAWSRGVVRVVRQRSRMGLAPRQRGGENVMGQNDWYRLVEVCFIA
jgi:hypothetical protein